MMEKSTQKNKQSLGKRLIAAMRYISFLFACEALLATLLSYYACFWLSHLYNFPIPRIAGLWGAISSVLVIYPLTKDSLKAGKSRFTGSVIGTVVPCTFLYIFGYHLLVLAMACSIFFSVILISIINCKEAFRTAGITLFVVVLVGSIIQPEMPIWLNGLTRLLESVVGISITLLVVLCFYPIRKYLDWFHPKLQ